MTSPRSAKLGAARKAKQDEFYTPLAVVEEELSHYDAQFAGASVFCNCDDAYASQFFRYFALNFERLGLRRVVAIGYAGSAIADQRGDARAYEAVLDSSGLQLRPLEGDGGFESEESIARLREADIAVTNPPFSRFRDYVAQLMRHKKQFLIVGTPNVVTYKEIWPLIQGHKVWPGVTANGGERWFDVPAHYPDGKNMRVTEDGRRQYGVGIRWFTNLDHKRRHEEIPLWARYADTPEKYPRYDNYDAIEVSRVNEIPADYGGVMGVPLTFLGKWDLDQFEILGASDNGAVPEKLKLAHHKKHNEPYIHGKKVYTRIFIRAPAPATETPDNVAQLTPSTPYPLEGRSMTTTDPRPIIYTQPGCTPCRAVVARFNNYKVPYELVDISEDSEAFGRLQQAGITGTPAFDLGQGLTTRVSDALEYIKDYTKQQEDAA